MLVCLQGDAIIFSLSGWSQTVVMLLVTRILGGLCSPVTPALAWLVDTAHPDNIARAMGINFACLTAGFMVGAGVGGILSPFGFEVACGVSSGVCLIAFAIIYSTNAASKSKVDIRCKAGGEVAAIPLETEDVDGRSPAFRAIFSREFSGLSVLCFASGIQSGEYNSTVGLILKDYHGWNASQVSTIHMASSILIAVAMVLLFPVVFKAVGKHHGAWKIVICTTVLDSALHMVLPQTLSTLPAFLAAQLVRK
jgi:MFS family permease